MPGLAHSSHRFKIDKVLRRMRQEQFVSNPLRLAVIVLLGIGAIAVVLAVHHGLVFGEGPEAQNGAPVSSFSVHSDPKPLPKVAEKSAGANDSTAAAAGNATEKSPAGSVVPGVKASSNTDNCTAELAELQQEYTKEVQKTKRILDDTLSFKLGSSITSQYVADYNRTVTDLFNEYMNKSTAENCVWPIKEPPLLSTDYLL
jgi:hypothetical protein